MLQLPLNNLLTEKADAVVDPMVIRQPVVKRPIGKRLVADLKRKETAADAVRELERGGCELFGLTRGQFSLTDLIEAILVKTGPTAMLISTWTAANNDVSRMLALLESGKVSTCRWLVDQTFVRRAPELAARIRTSFGADAIRVTRNHAKFALIENDGWLVALRSSMNLNQNQRLESFQVGHDPEVCHFLRAVADDIWRRQDRRLATSRVREVDAWIRAERAR